MAISILEFAVAPQQGSICISSECDPSSMSVSRHCFLNGVWLFEKAVNRDDLKSGKLDDSAAVHIHCGHEVLSAVAATVELEFDADHIAGRHLLLPYDLPSAEVSRAAGISASAAKAAVVDHWNSFLARGAQFRTGVPQLDNLYRTCLVNIMLMRTMHPGAAADGGDLYVVKPGAGIYDNFWTRDGSYIATSLGLAGYPGENEQSLRLFWQHGLKDPMMSATLATLDSHMEEDVYIYSRGRLWTYITADIAMCHLLRDELDLFYRFYNGFVAHASPTNAWVEGILCDDERRGTGDMPHGWAAAEYIFLHRNSLVYENGNTLELCWGVQPEWLSDGSAISAKNAPTRFGKVDLEVRREGGKLAASFSVDGSNFPSPGKIALHVPRLDGVNEITVNTKRFPLKPGPNVLTID